MSWLATASRRCRIKDVAAGSGMSESCLQNWLTQADRDDGIRPGPTSVDNAELRGVSVERWIWAGLTG
jgi:hypothetical protein